MSDDIYVYIQNLYKRRFQKFYSFVYPKRNIRNFLVEGERPFTRVEQETPRGSHR